MVERAAHTLSEQEVEQQMYKAISGHVKADGVNMTTEEIAQAVDAQTPDSPPEPSADEEAVLERMVAYQAEHPYTKLAYVVRGALLHCQYGSHYRRLNLPRCHGVYTLKKPLMFKKDCVAGTEGADINITTFGVCSSPHNPSGESITYVAEAPRNPDGSFTGEEASGTVTGIPCVPDIIGVWKNTYANTHIGKEDEEALTTHSCLACRHQGLIEIIRSGQEDSDE